MRRALRRWWWLLLLAPVVAGLARLRFDVEVLNLLPAELPVVRGLQLYQRHFADSRELVLTLQAPDAEAARQAAGALAARLRAESRLIGSVIWQPPLLESPDQSAELIAWLWLNQPPEVVGELAARLAPDRVTATLERVRAELATSLSPAEIARLGYDPLGLTRLPATAGSLGDFAHGEPGFASGDGAFRVLYVRPARELGGYRDCANWLGAVRRVAFAVRDEIAGLDAGVGESGPRQPPPHPPTSGQPDRTLEIHFTGGPAFLAEVATGMERDFRNSALGTLALIAGLFWFAHRRWRPLLWLTVMLTVVMLGTLALGGLIFATLNVVSLGFAAILLGLAVDYGLVLHQEATAGPGRPFSEIRRMLAPGIVGSAATSAVAFALLNFAGLPGLAQLGTLIALGVLLAAGVMLFAYLPLAQGRTVPACLSPAAETPALPDESLMHMHQEFVVGSSRRARARCWGSALVAVLGVAALAWRAPGVDHSAVALQPKHCPADLALKELRARLSEGGEAWWLLVQGADESQTARKLSETERVLQTALQTEPAARVALPVAAWPDPARQQSNRVTTATMVGQAAALRAAVTNAGFTDEAWSLAGRVLEQWRTLGADAPPYWPTNALSRWVTGKFAARTPEGWLAAGMVSVPDADARLAAAAARALPDGVWLTEWTLLGEALLRHVEGHVLWLSAAIAGLVVVCLWLTFRRLTEVVLSFATLGLGLVLLLAVMGLAGWSWNLMNLTALPLLLGAGVDYTIHLQLALRRQDGDARRVWRGTGRAVLLCAATTTAGFGSLAFASNAGLASLGTVCAVGVAGVAGVALVFLPAWWGLTKTAPACDPAAGAGAVSGGVARATVERISNSIARGPSSAYRAEIWRAGLWIARWLPAPAGRALAALGATFYCLARPGRVAVVTANLLPIFNGDVPAARRAARRNVFRFAEKVFDLWRFEAGVPVDAWRNGWSGWEHFEAARAGGRGVLLLTPHLGNWEFGGAFVAQRGVKLLVLTQPEPGAGFTELRQAARARWGIETLVVREDPFAFVEVIKRLQAGAVVALLVDRPPAPTAVAVELFGRRFRASVAPAELARATGCALLPVQVVHVGCGYAARVLPEVPYDRAALGNREARRRLTQEIVRAFEPVLREHPEQWYHFVPIWPGEE